MDQEKAVTIFSVIFLAAILVYVNLPPSVEVETGQSASVVDAIPDVISNFTIDEPEPTEINEASETSGPTETDQGNEELFDLDSLDEDALEGEFQDIQSGIDLLNNPLQ